MLVRNDDNRGITKVARRINDKLSRIELHPIGQTDVHDMSNTYKALDYERRHKTPETPMTEDRLKAMRAIGAV